MTPEELLYEINEYVFWDETKHFLPENYAENRVLELIQQAKKEWCKQQREKCRDEIIEKLPDDHTFGQIEDLILNATEP